MRILNSSTRRLNIVKMSIIKAVHKLHAILIKIQQDTIEEE